ncbi:MAG: DEAD/DEAH box helicase, partial [Thermoanaerobaculia bacterium]|nr:DEAD/DEAH box helicase [Thermoanaerobaculia bacterium]
MNEESRAPFESLGLRAEILSTLTALGYEAPTPIQEKTIPVMLAGRDLIGQAQTGTGKTAAFALPILQNIDPELMKTQALVLAPTRELAMQVAEAFHTYAKGLGQITVLPVYGGAPMYLQLRHLERGAQIVVGTPGRLIDHLERGTLKLEAVRTVVLDEADEMLRMGFIDDVELILSKVQSPRQTALFSATMPPEIKRIASRHLSDPAKIEVEHKSMAAPEIEQRFINVNEAQKLDVLTKILELEPSEATLVFRRTKNGAAELAERLEARGFSAQAMHGDMTQSLRESVIRRLKAGQIEVVVATDVAARGLDVEQIEHVVNFDIPHDQEVYVHRIGRTGRAGRSGVATLFVTPRERKMLRDIERFTGGVIAQMRMPTHADVHAKRVTVFKKSVRKSLEDGDLELYTSLVSEIAEESGRDIAEVAAAAARLANGSRSLELKPEPVVREQAVRPQVDMRSEFKQNKAKYVERAAAPGRKAPSRAPIMGRVEQQSGDPGKAGIPMAPTAGERLRAYKKDEGRRERPMGAERKPFRDSRSEPKARLAIALGIEHGLRPADVVGSIANEAGVPGRDIGPIEIGETSTIVSVPENVAAMVIEKLASARLRGKSFRIRREGAPLGRRDDGPEAGAERPEQAASAPREYKRAVPAGDRPRNYSRDDRGGPPARKPYPSADRPAKPAGHKPFYSRFQEGAAPATGEEQEKKPYRAKSDSYAKPAGDRPYRAKSDSYAKPAGDRPYRAKSDSYAKPAGDRPYRAKSD